MVGKIDRAGDYLSDYVGKARVRAAPIIDIHQQDNNGSDCRKQLSNAIFNKENKGFQNSRRKRSKIKLLDANMVKMYFSKSSSILI